MKKRILSLCMLLAFLLTATATLASCNRESTHTHAFPTEWKSDEAGHWRACAVTGCPETVAAAHHTFDAGVVTREPSAEQDGTKVYTCTVCGAARQETLVFVPEPVRNTVSEEEFEAALDGELFYNVTAEYEITLLRGGDRIFAITRELCTPLWVKPYALTDGVWVSYDTVPNTEEGLGTALILDLLSPCAGRYTLFTYDEAKDAYTLTETSGDFTDTFTLYFEGTALAALSHHSTDGIDSLTVSARFSDYGTTEVADPTLVTEEEFEAAISSAAFTNLTLKLVTVDDLAQKMNVYRYKCLDGVFFDPATGAESTYETNPVTGFLALLSGEFYNFYYDDTGACYVLEDYCLSIDDSLLFGTLLVRFDNGRLTELMFTGYNGLSFALSIYDRGITEAGDNPESCTHRWIKSSSDAYCADCYLHFSDFTLPEDCEGIPYQMGLGSTSTTVLFYEEYACISIGGELYFPCEMFGDVAEIVGLGIFRTVDTENHILNDVITTAATELYCIEDEQDDGITTVTLYSTGLATVCYAAYDGSVETLTCARYAVLGETVICETLSGLLFFNL